MLNELRELAICLEKAKIKVKDLHPNFKICPKYPTYWVYLDKEGNIADIAPIPSAQIQSIRKWEKSNGVSFPAFNMPPFFKASTEDVQEQIKGLKKRIEKEDIITVQELTIIIDSCEKLWDKKNTNKRLSDCFKKPINDISKFIIDTPDSYKAINQLIFRTQLINVDKFKEQLIKTFLQQIQNAPETGIIDALFFYSGKTPTNFQIILELADRDCFDYPANHQEVQRWMNRQFLNLSAKDSNADFDAFGCNATGKNGKFPSVGFKNALGNVRLRAMNQESPCQTRYGMIDYHSFPAGEEVRKGMKSALEWLSGKERKGKTWCDLSRRMERPMLLFTYPSVIPQNLPDLAGMMGEAEDDTTETNEERFVSLAEKVTVAFQGIIKETVDCEIRVFVLSKMDNAHTKIMASSRYSAEHVIQSAQSWQEGCRNLPIIEVRCFGKNKGDKSVWNKPLIPFPAESVWCLNTIWMMGRDEKGERYSRAKAGHGFTFNDALCLLLGENFELRQMATRALGTLLRNSSSLLLALGQAHAYGLVQKTEKKYSKQPLLLPSILGLLLHKLGHAKGEIMTSSTFLVGRLLALADGLHVEYCRHVRNNSIPSQLVGNALMPTALEAPWKALSMLSQRVLPYQAWARTAKSGEEVNLAKFFLKHLGEVSNQLKDASLPQRASDVDKAQMLLGYLARAKQD